MERGRFPGRYMPRPRFYWRTVIGHGAMDWSCSSPPVSNELVGCNSIDRVTKNAAVTYKQACTFPPSSLPKASACHPTRIYLVSYSCCSWSFWRCDHCLRMRVTVSVMGFEEAEGLRLGLGTWGGCSGCSGADAVAVAAL